jgi:hypothetical protein
VSTLLDSPAVAVALYVLGATTAILLGVIERRRGGADDPQLWAFWFLTGVLLLVMAVARSSNVNDLLADLGRDRARSGGWYDVRRSLQAWVIGGVAGLCALTVAVAVWRAPGRRRRYLPTAIVVFTLVCFAGVRLISLHQVDVLLNDRDVSGVSLGSVIEVGLLVLVVVVVAVSACHLPRSASTSADGRSEPARRP